MWPVSVAVRIRLLSCALAAVAVAVYLTTLRGVGVPSATFQLPWWALMPLFVAGEVFLVHLHFRRDNHSFSMTDVPLALGMLFVPPSGVLAASLLSSLLSLGVYRRLSAVKMVFNVSSGMCSVSVGLVVFHAIVPSYAAVTGAVWIGIFAGVVTAALLAGITVVLAISLAEGSFQVDRLPLILTLQAAGAFTNTSLGLIAGTLLLMAPSTAWLLLVPAATLFAAYRAYMREREKHDSLEFLYHSARILSETPELDAAVSALVARAREMFRAELAEMLLATPDAQDMLRARIADDDAEPGPMERIADPVVLALQAHLQSRPEVTLAKAPTGDAVVDAYLAANDLRDAIIAPLRGDGQSIGLVIVGNRVGGATFDAEDSRLFATLANHASIALENGRLEQSLSQLRELETQLKKLAFHDPLTGLANRSLFAERVAAALATERADGHDCAVLFVDLDDFKTINDTLGHAAGDRLLCAVAERLVDCVRPDDTAARLGGDEFAVLLDDVADTAEVERVATRITEALRTPVVFAGQEVTVGASVGIAPGASARSADELLGNADLAMYIAKSEGKGSYAVFEPPMRAEVAKRHHLKADLVKAADRGEFVLHYQPIVDLQTGRPVAFEALIRWSHPQFGLLLPDSFIPIAEETGLIGLIGQLVLRDAATQAAQWQRDFPGQAVSVNVNLSPLQVRLPALVEDVAEVLRRTALRPGSLVLEITESLMLHDAAASVQVLRRLRALGVRIALDDFGTGYSSLGQLRMLPIDMLKIAKTFVEDLDGHGETTAFTSAIVALGQTLGVTTLAEGVEQPWQASELRRLGCELAQGFYFAKAMPAGDVDGFLRRHLDAADGAATIYRLPA
jgi:diguanylate cyclase (GGDEF)-like protein